MHSTMQDTPLEIRRLLEHGSSLHSASCVSTATLGEVRRGSYREVGANAARLAHALRALGVRADDRVATFMWNNQEHVEAYFAVPCMGAVLHPLNFRLAEEQIRYVANHAEDKVVIVDASLLPAFARLVPEMRTVEHVVVSGSADHTLLDGTGIAVHDYQQLIDSQPDSYPWPDTAEHQAAAMCYTSGTTGDPKGVVYSHRSIYLHAMAITFPDTFGLSARDCMLAIVPQFHVLAWGLPYAAFLTGASLAMPDRFLAAEPLAAFIAAARPNKAAGVPAVWRTLLQYVDAHPDADISSLQEGMVGGSACAESLMRDYQERYGITLLHAWGMTETSPLGSVARPPASADLAESWRYRISQGRFVGPVEARLVGPNGSVLPNDGRSAGELHVRGPWITARYYRDNDQDKFPDGWLRTGDVGIITPDGYLTLTDRTKDVIKSGGEWISSVDLENHLMSHPAVYEAAVIGIPDERWGERPLATIVVSEGQQVSPTELRDYLAAKLPRWQLPDHWSFLTEVPKTSVGKFDKKVLRQQHAGGVLDIQQLR
ncbi:MULTISPECIES: long-chain fatty acid--CoA ligase [unclassified Frankia]|uniref:long-chain fatty acid--CoA ligase n=2 Tax=Frankia TaxID=1854 RepID=UPI001EF70C9B|nr:MULTISPECIES: long-chain fatty acid--CoA ligase [unclassified Frankia]